MTPTKEALELAREIVEEYFYVPDVDSKPDNLILDIARQFDKQAQLINALRLEAEAAQNAVDTGLRVVDVLEGRREIDLTMCKKPWEFYMREAYMLRIARLKLEDEMKEK